MSHLSHRVSDRAQNASRPCHVTHDVAPAPPMDEHRPRAAATTLSIPSPRGTAACLYGARVEMDVRVLGRPVESRGRPAADDGRPAHGQRGGGAAHAAQRSHRKLAAGGRARAGAARAAERAGLARGGGRGRRAAEGAPGGHLAQLVDALRVAAVRAVVQGAVLAAHHGHRRLRRPAAPRGARS